MCVWTVFRCAAQAESPEQPTEILPALGSGSNGSKLRATLKHRMFRPFQTIEIRKWEGFIMNMVIFPRTGILAGNM